MAFATLAAPAAATGGDRAASTSLSVAAVVVPFARLDLVEQPRMLTITEEDVRRGQVEVDAASRVAVRSNGTNGFWLRFDLDRGLFTSAQVHGLDRSVRLGARGGVVEQLTTGTSSSDYELAFTFAIAPSVRPGVYSWPVHITAASRGR